MDQFTPNQNVTPAPGSFPGGAPQKKPIGPWAGIVIVVLLLVAGGFYFWGAQLNRKPADTLQPFILGDDAMQNDAAAGLPAQGTSDDAADLEAELNAMNMEQFEAAMEGSVSSFEKGAQ